MNPFAFALYAGVGKVFMRCHDCGRAIGWTRGSKVRILCFQTHSDQRCPECWKIFDGK